MSRLLVSVRNAREAEIALAGGASLIDVKEPTRGALGRADEATLAAVAARVAGRAPLSAALGELFENEAPFPNVAGLHFVKWGLAGAAGRGWQRSLTKQLERPGPQAVVVAYADWRWAEAPSLDEVVAFACSRRGNVLLIDTYQKNSAEAGKRPPTLLDWLSAAEVQAICRACAARGVRVALAGSLGLAEIDQLLSAGPTWFAVRGAVCAGGQRDAPMDLARVQELACRIRMHARPAD
ncbi:MAG: (5-formylfuran-3-yl)methyl phosphate synthase [Gemmataceae bacterium]|nr:(5-formylfuran-3-yl)methyl phosphate synthase [Gemmataceae bacterium]